MSTASTSISPTPTVFGGVVRYDVRERVAEVTLDRPDVSNAIDVETARALHQAIERAATDSAANVVLLQGAGRLFCAGGDLAAMGAAPDRPAFVSSLANAAHEAVKALDALTKPVVVAVQGAAAGIGLSLVLGADLVVAGASARFVTAYTSVGLTPDGGLSWLLPRTVGQRRAIELILTSEPLDAARAQTLGIVSEICEDAEVATAARAAAARLAARPAHALGAARGLVRASWARTLEEHLDKESETIARASGEQETAALIASFLDRG
ncbi:MULTISPECIES: enoyl-CoA hydratase/isomerase family protein [Protofrankia]|uniref:Enoyl-CoA hydratase/isomerase n=1 Tax=Candidatus Protofrankia datiscae TaxID=2716812 RepID=F8AXI5_9ACTN|nr:MULTISPECIES: enoyl-CoA hydratase/isomerase family protein [Protofrankia]AEH09472.1 Enoyl-CoA hydratase/isomerase [Candidatus Protofrankia datiscae]